MNFNDRFVRGFWAGVIAGIVQTGFMQIAMALGLTNLLFRHFATVLMYGHRLQGDIIPVIFAELVLWSWCGLLGIAFAYLIVRISSTSYRFKGAIYGISIWFLSYITIVLLKVPEFKNIAFKSALTNAVGGLLWGIVLAETLRLMDDRLKAGQ